jgi:hypothetical protein
MDDVDLRKSWAEKTTDWVAENFSYRRNAEAYVSLYKDLIRGSRK